MPLIDLAKPAIHFDKISDILVKERLKIELKPKSIDCLYIDNGLLTLVEFKNTISINKKIDDIKMKIHDTLLLLNYLYHFDDSDFRLIEIVIVRKKAPVASNQKSSRHLMKLAESSCPPRLKFLQKAYRIKISSMNQDEYSNRIG